MDAPAPRCVGPGLSGNGPRPLAGAVRHASFPMDGMPRWLRWIDGVDVGGYGTGTPTLQAALSPLPAGTDLRRLPSVGEVAPQAGWTSHPVHAGSLPNLRLGSVFVDGAHVGDLGMEPSGLRRFGPGHHSSLVRCDAANPMPAPSWWTRAWTVLPRSRYPLGYPPPHCMQFHSGSRQLLVPCSEIFKVFCAPESLLANALLSGPWTIVRPRVMNEDWNEREPDRWRVGLRTGLTGRSALPAAAYEWTTWGRQVSSTMTGLAGTLPRGPRALQARIPYLFPQIAIEGDGLALLDNPDAATFLCLRITAASFPGGLEGLPAEIAYRLDNYNAVRGEPGAAPEPGGFRKRVITGASEDGTGLVTVTPFDPPSRSAEGGAIPTAAVDIGGTPSVVRVELAAAPPASPRRRSLRVAEPVGMASTARPQRGSADVRSVSHPAGEAPAAALPNLGMVAVVLDELLGSGAIDEWCPVPPRLGPWTIVSGMVAWLAPAFVEGTQCAWSYVGPGRRRACLVAAIRSGDRTVHWLELERRATSVGGHRERFRFLLLAAADDGVEDAVSALLRRVALPRSRRVWPDGADAATLLGPDAAVRWEAFRHAYEVSERVAPAGAPAPRIRGGWAASKIRDFM